MTDRSSSIQREILPIPQVSRPVPTTQHVSNQDPPFPKADPLRPPAGAPNVIIVLIDDMGFGASSAFGGPCQMPTAERLASDGLRYNRFHTTALCSPTRAALLTGRNHHSAGIGTVQEIATAAPGLSGIRPNSVAPIAKMLAYNGYSTGAFGKMHQTPPWEVSPSGPFDRWPTGEGFEKFYGFVGGEANQWEPLLFDGTTKIEPPKTASEGYHLSEDIVDQTINWIQSQQALTPDKPFFSYVSFGATHAPFHVGREWIEKYKGQFDDGWHAQRERTLERQKDLGVIPRDAELSPWPEEATRWEELTENEQKLASALMETYAGFAEHTDSQVGRLVDALDAMKVLDNTLIYYILGDNGASAEGTLSGTFNELISLNGLRDIMGIREDADELVDRLDELGSPNSYPHYNSQWALAMDTPYQWSKQVASHYGGTRNGLVVHWPKGIDATNEIRTQWHHVIDVVPTLLELAGLPEPYSVDGVAQKPIEGTSMAYSFNDANAADRHTTQYFEMFGNRGIYHHGWTAVAMHRVPWAVGAAAPPLDQDKWELYDTNSDWTQARDLAAENPGKLSELQDQFLIEAAKYDVFPIDDRLGERFNPALAGRPDLMGDRTSMTVYRGMSLMENAVLNVKNRSHTLTADIEVPDDGATGVIVVQGGRFAGWSFYVDNGRLSYCHNLVNIERHYVRSGEVLTPGRHTVSYHFAYDGEGVGKGGTGTLRIDDRVVGEGRIERTVPMIFSADETLDVGSDSASPVTDDYPDQNNGFNGIIHSVRIDLGDDDHRHLEDPELQERKVMARQ